MRLPILTVQDVAEQQLCTGCGACAYISPDELRMIDIPTLGRRPVGSQSPSSATARDALRVCPGLKLEHTFDRQSSEYNKDLMSAWGPVKHVWEGYAADNEIRHGGSSGGAATAISLYCIEKAGMHGVLHTKASDNAPLLNETTLSTSRESLMRSSGSRYAPASPCDGLADIEKSPGQCVFIGKPCDVAAVQKTRELRPGLDKNIGLTIAFFCAGTPSTNGTMDLLKKTGVSDLNKVHSIRYRGNGWPGRWVAEFTDDNGCKQTQSMSYTDSWHFLQRYRQWRCYICPDHTGEFADIAVGDPWYREPTGEEPGRSLIVARTSKGVEILKDAQRAGYIILDKQDASLLPRSQPNILETRGNNWGRLLALRFSHAPLPTYNGFPMIRYWIKHVSFRSKVQSIAGTLRRIRSKKLKTPVAIVECESSLSTRQVPGT